jgi:hypothetical protein
MSPPRLAAPSITGRNTRSSTRVIDTGTQEMPTIVDVNVIHTLEYELNTIHIEEEQNPAHEVGQPEDAQRTKSDSSRGKGPQQAE